MSDRLRGKVAIVTGASRGIGEAIARGLAAEGARVACVARTRNEGDKRVAGSLQATVAAIEAAGGEAVPLVADLRDLDACARVVDEARSALGPIDVLVNNAAWTWFAPVAEFPVEQWLRSFAINVHAPMVLSRAVLADMIPRDRAPSSTSRRARRAVRVVAPTRHRRSCATACCTAPRRPPLERFSQGLAEEVYPHGVAVAALSPSQVVVTAGVIFHEAVFDRDEAHTEPPEMMARAAVLLASEPLDRVTGRVCYSQQILQEFGWIDSGRGTGIDSIGSGYSQM